MEPLDDCLQYLDQITKIQKEIDEVNDMEYNDKLTLKDVYQDKLHWDEEKGCLRHPRITKLQESLFDERSEIVRGLSDFWSTALFADCVLTSYMNEEEQKIFKYLKSLDVFYDGDAKSEFIIQLDMEENPYFEELTLTKTFRFCREGISSESGSEITWKNDKDIEVFAEREGSRSHTDTPSFLKWFWEDSEKLRDLVAEEIVQEFWPNAHEYYFIAKDRCAGKEGLKVTEIKRARRKHEGEEDIPGALSKLRTISDKLKVAKQQAREDRCAMKLKYDLMLVKGERDVHKKCENMRRCIYDRRTEIIKKIRHFWLIAFLSHYALHLVLSKEDMMILKYLNSVNVEETEDEEGVMSGYKITLNFGENPYFENRSLTKAISYTVISEDPIKDYCDSRVKIRVSVIKWRDGKDITSRSRQGFTDTEPSFFTWFSDLGCVAVKAYDEVANLIKQDFWPNAGKYFVNGNRNDEEEVDFVGIGKMEYFVSSMRTFFL